LLGVSRPVGRISAGRTAHTENNCAGGDKSIDFEHRINVDFYSEAIATGQDFPAKVNLSPFLELT
jgi:hypothetical protein